MRCRAASVVVCGLRALPPGAAAPGEPVLWPERQRAFAQDGPGLLLSAAERERLAGLAEAEREGFIEEFLARDPLPATPGNELVLGIERRQRLVRAQGFSPLDVRAQLLFLHGEPAAREEIECGQTFKPLELWTLPEGMLPRQLVLYRPGPVMPWKLWLPIDSKRVLYTSEMEYFLEQFEELKGRITGRRIDLQTCPDTPKVDDATGVEGIFGFRKDRPTNQQFERLLQPPPDLAEWARRAAATPLPEGPADLAVEDFAIVFPARIRQRIVSRFLVTLPAGVALATATEAEKPELRVGVDGLIEQEGGEFERFRVLFTLDPAVREGKVALSLERSLRPQRSYVVRLRVRDEVGGGEAFLARGFAVPAEPQPVPEPPVPEEVVIALGEELAEQRIAGLDTLFLVPPPEGDVILGLWRAEALVTGERIRKVGFFVDGRKQVTRTQPPFSAELRLAQYPTEQVVRVEGYDATDQLVAADEVVLNQPKGSLRVRILEPARGVAVSGPVEATAEVVVPEDRRVERVEFLVNDQLVATLERPPWEARVESPPGVEVVYLTVVATLDDGSRAEDVRFLAAPRYLEEVEVNLVELYTTVTDRSGRLVRDLAAEDFQVLEDGRAQAITKFELVEDLPLTLGITIDTSGSMVSSLPEAQRAAQAFLENIITPRDRYFAVSFADKPSILNAPTDDVRAVENILAGLRSEGWTSLHDAVVTTLYYFRGVRGRRAMILLSDGDDNASGVAFRDALEFARRSGVAIYSIGLNIPGLDLTVRNKLTNLAEETGGRTFFISKAEELVGVYDEIEEELRSQYLVAYSSDRPGAEGAFRAVEVKVRGGGLKARTIRGYYP